jgi:hypothetical protein
MIGVTPALISVRTIRFGVLHLSFEDGVSGAVNIADDLWGPAFAHARTPKGFFDVTLDPETRAPTWPGNADFAPDVLYERVRAGGETPPS